MNIAIVTVAGGRGGGSDMRASKSADAGASTPTPAKPWPKHKKADASRQDIDASSFLSRVETLAD